MVGTHAAEHPRDEGVVRVPPACLPAFFNPSSGTEVSPNQTEDRWVITGDSGTEAGPSTRVADSTSC